MKELATRLLLELNDKYKFIEKESLDLESDASYLEGNFTSEELRAIADAMDKLKESNNGEVQEER